MGGTTFAETMGVVRRGKEESCNMTALPTCDFGLVQSTVACRAFDEDYWTADDMLISYDECHFDLAEARDSSTGTISCKGFGDLTDAVSLSDMDPDKQDEYITKLEFE